MGLVQRIDAASPDPAVMAGAADLLRAGRLVAYPTETFYGLAGDPLHGECLEAIYAAKGRPERMALPLIAADLDAVRKAVRDFPAAAGRLAEAFWPGPLTLVLTASPSLPSRLLGGGRTVGIRISPHPVATGLARSFGGAIVATSANRSGQPAPLSAEEVEGALGAHLALILDGGPTRGGQASTVLDLSLEPPRLVRSGAVPVAAIERILGRRAS